MLSSSLFSDMSMCEPSVMHDCGPQIQEHQNIDMFGGLLYKKYPNKVLTSRNVLGENEGKIIEAWERFLIDVTNSDAIFSKIILSVTILKIVENFLQFDLTLKQRNF